ncbi:MAG: TolC family protein, partial [Polyangiaceae bacterium]
MRKALLPFVAVCLLSSVARAQPAPVPAPPEAPRASANPIALPPPPPVSDPMLAPVPPARRIVSSWQEALGYLRARSTDLKIALA